MLLGRSDMQFVLTRQKALHYQAELGNEPELNSVMPDLIRHPSFVFNKYFVWIPGQARNDNMILFVLSGRLTRQKALHHKQRLTTGKV
jgi:hypothetical protein